MTPLDRTLKRSLHINGIDYVVTLSPDALKLTRKGKRLGLELKWADITSGESALAVALQASVAQFPEQSIVARLKNGAVRKQNPSTQPLIRKQRPPSRK